MRAGVNENCPQCGAKAKISSVACAQCGSPLRTSSTGRWGTLEIPRSAVPMPAAPPPRPPPPPPGPPPVPRLPSLPPIPALPPIPGFIETSQVPQAGSRAGGTRIGGGHAGSAVAVVPTRAAATLSAATPSMAPLAGIMSNADVFDTGMRTIGGPFASVDAGSPLSLESDLPPALGPVDDSLLPPALRDSPPSVPAPTPEVAPSPAQPPARATKAHELGGYGPMPKRLYETPPYMVRVMLRRHVLRQELAELSLERKRLEAQEDEALITLAEALYELRDDARAKPLAQHLRVVT
jgi:hypothetical protein